MNYNELNSDDIDQLFKGIQSKLEGKEDLLNSLIPKFQEKYKFFQIQESNKKLLGRFQLRLSELMEKCKNQNQFNYLDAIQQKLITFNFIKILDQIHNTGNENKIKDIVPQFKQQTNWQQYNKINKSLFEFYEVQFWKLYGILLLNEENIENMILYYQSKQDNVERLLKISLERNKQFSYIKQQKYPQLATIEYKAQQMNLSQMNCTMETSYQNKNIRMFGILTQNQKFNRFNSTSPKKYLRTNFIKKGWSLDNNEIQVPDSIDQKTRNFSQNTSNSIIFSNQTVRERTQNQSFSQKNNLNGQYSTNQTPYNQKKISSVDINQSFNQFATSTQSVSPKRQFKKPKINQNLNQSFYKQLFPSQRSKNRAFILMKNILLNESKGIHNYTYSNMLFNQKQLKY
ncbi:unnamed protein product [Paramecium primaurelia]|uniref:Uncharacterized protein n=1 Tax=Paramecium primaurelia TaxID=5886 RepID=A0A8S1PSM1_PARPR|nr:unnamed protein product [Paramecium primaurelia]